MFDIEVQLYCFDRIQYDYRQLLSLPTICFGAAHILSNPVTAAGESSPSALPVISFMFSSVKACQMFVLVPLFAREKIVGMVTIGTLYAWQHTYTPHLLRIVYLLLELTDNSL